MVCIEKMRLTKRNDTLIWRCPKTDRRERCSIRITYRFLFFKGNNGIARSNLSIRDMMLDVYLFIHTSCTLSHTIDITGIPDFILWIEWPSFANFVQRHWSRYQI